MKILTTIIAITFLVLLGQSFWHQQTDSENSKNNTLSLESSVALCKAKTMNWEEYLAYRETRKEDYATEQSSLGADPNFVSFNRSAMNNTDGAWSSVIQMPLVAAAAANLPNGKLMTWSAKDKFSFGGNEGKTWTAVFDPATNSAVDLLITNTQHDMFCPGINTLPDGRILVAGGSSSDKTSIYNPNSGQWTSTDPMNIARGYLSNTSLASGATFLIGGSWSGGVGGKDAEIWTEKSGWYELSGLPVDVILDGINADQPIGHDDYFPWLWQAPNGKLFHAGPSPKMHWIDPTGVGSYTDAGTRGNDDYAVSGTTVMYDVGKILKTGGSNTFEQSTPASNKCYTIDINGNTAQANQTGNMNSARVYHNSVVLPSGEVMALGGIPQATVFSDNGSVFTPELWNPNTGNWTTIADMAVARNYHSVALLMLDGRVFTAGGGLCGSCSTNHPDAQIYSPPYLFNSGGGLATRPVINAAPSSADYNSNINVSMNSGVSSFVLVRAAGVTHSTNNEQRRIPLSSTSIGGNQYQLSIPNRNIVPPGHYMLFAMNSAGTPSVAKVIMVGDDINSSATLPGTNPGGTGLTGTYFNNDNFTAEVLDRLDPTINFDWGNGSPDPAIGANTFSVRWEGSIQVPREGGYTFYTNSDDGVRLFIDGKPMINNWTVHAETEDIGMINLEAGQSYDIVMEYFEGEVTAVIELRWSGPGINKQIVPSQYLFPINGGNPCDGQGGDADGDGVCGNVDNCPNNFNPGQEDNDNDGIGDVCDSGGTCGVSTSNCAITINGLGSVDNAKVFDSNWSVVWQCDPWMVGNNTCTNTELISSLPTGSYWVQACGETISYNVSCGGGNPCDGQGGDADGDGVCGNVDNCPNNANPGQQDSDGDGIGDACDTVDPCAGQGGDTDNDGVCNNQDNCPNNFNPGQADSDNDGIGDVCDAPAGCSVTTANCSLTINGLSASDNAKVFNASWNIVWQCDPWGVGDVCSATETLTNLSSGTYWVQACGETTSYNVSCGGGNPCDGQGGDADGDGVCGNVDNCPNNANPGQQDADNDGVGDACDTGGNPCDGQGGDTDGDSVCGNVDNCPNTSNPGQQDSDGDGIGDACDSGGTDCDGISITSNGGSITISNLNAPIEIVKVFSPTWQTVFNCTADCNSTETISGLGAGNHYVTINMYNASWQPICEITETINVTGGSPSLSPNSEILYFTTEKKGTDVALKWTTNTEHKNAYYIIEHATDNEHFSTLAIVEKQFIEMEEFVPVYYDEKDTKPSIGANQYRIKQVFMDGSYRYSVIRHVTFDAAVNEFTIYPNPTDGELFVSLKDFIGQSGEIQIYNLLGQPILQRRIEEITGEDIALDLSQLTNGIYHVSLLLDGQRSKTQSFVIGKR